MGRRDAVPGLGLLAGGRRHLTGHNWRVVDEGGDAACWLDRVCDDCGAFTDDGHKHECRAPIATLSSPVVLSHTDGMHLAEPPCTPEQEAAYEADRESGGYVANFVRLWCWRPDVLEAFAETRSLLVEESALTQDDVAVIVTAAVTARSDSYCALAWGRRLSNGLDERAAVAVITGDDAALDERHRALARWARQVVTDPNSTGADDVDGLRSVGLDDRQIFEATALVAFRLAFSTINDALGARPDAQLAAAVPAGVRDAVTFGRPPATEPSL